MNESWLQITAAFSRRHHTISNLFVHFRLIHWLKNYPKIFLTNRLKKLIQSLSMDLFFFKTNLAFASGEEKYPIWTSGTLMNVAQTVQGAFGLGLRIRVWYKGYTENMIALVTRHGSFEKGAVSCSSSQHMRNKSALCETAKRHKAQNIKSLWRINASLNTLHSQFT